MILQGYFVHVIIITMGLAFMQALLGVNITQLTPLRRWLAFGIVILIYITAFISLLYLGEEIYRQLYPIFVQMPVVTVFLIVGQRGFNKTLFAFLTTLNMVGTPISIMRFLTYAFHLSDSLSFLAMCLSAILIFLILRRWGLSTLQYVFLYQENRWWVYLCVPFAYWIGGYFANRYVFASDASPSYIILSLTLWLVVALSYILIFFLFNHMHTLHITNEELRMVSAQQESAQATIKQMRLSNEQAVTYRHDLRHHLALIDVMAKEGNIDPLREYISNITKSLNEVASAAYCQNETVNLLFSSFATKASQQGISLQVNVSLPEKLPLSEIDLCTLLSNSMENAFTATAQYPDSDQRQIKISFTASQRRLLLSIKNPYRGNLIFKDGIPQNPAPGHGIGVRSMSHVVEKYNGVCSFQRNKEAFIFQAIIPMME